MQTLRSVAAGCRRTGQACAPLSIALRSQPRRTMFGNAFQATGACVTHAEEPYHISSRAVGPFAMNQYLVGCYDTRTAAIIDCGSPPKKTKDDASKLGLNITQLLQTHAHLDHVAGLADAKEMFPEAPIYLHPSDRVLYDTAEEQARMFGVGSLRPPPPPDHELSEGDTVSVGKVTFKVLYVPGHCPGHVAFYDEKNGMLFVGDVLFQGSIGRTDFPYSNQAQMEASLRKLMKLPDDVRVFPGHGSPTTIGEERKYSPFVQDYPRA